MSSTATSSRSNHVTSRALLVAALAASIAFTLAAAANALVIGGWDATRGGLYGIASGVELSALRSAIQTSFPGVTFTSTNTLATSYLAGVDVLMIWSGFDSTTAITPLSTAEQSALQAFVESGKGTMFFVDNDQAPGSNAAGNSMLQPFGIHLTGTVAGQHQMSTVANPGSSPVTSGPFGTVNKLDHNWAGWLDNLGSYAARLATLDYNGQTSLAWIQRGAIASGSGGLVVVTDGSTGDNGNLNFPDNKAMILNAVDYVRPTAPMEYAISGHVYRFDGSPLDSVSVNYSGGQTWTSASGLYSFTVPPGWSGSASVDKPSWGFIPGQITWSNVTTNLTDQDFHGGQKLTIGEAKLLPDGSNVYFSSVLVSGYIGWDICIQEADRSSGIRLSDYSFTGYWVINGGGVLTTVPDSFGAERCLCPAESEGVDNYLPTPLYMNNRTIGGGRFGDYTPGVTGGAGLNNIGLLVRTQGRVTYSSSDAFVIDDGSHVPSRFGAEVTGVEVDTKGYLPAPRVGKFVTVTGICSARKTYWYSDTYRLVRPRDESDIEILPTSAVYVYRNELDDALQFKALLDTNRIPTTIIPESGVASTDLLPYDVIIIGDDCLPYYGSPADVAIAASQKSVLGIGYGGVGYFWTLGLDIGWIHTALFLDQTTLFPEDLSSPMFWRPNVVLFVPTDLYCCTGVAAFGAYMPSIPPGVKALGSAVGRPEYQFLASQGWNVMWGFCGQSGYLTSDGQKLFVNAVWYAVSL